MLSQALGVLREQHFLLLASMKQDNFEVACLANDSRQLGLVMRPLALSGTVAGLRV